MTPADFFKFPKARDWTPTFKQDQVNYITRTIGNLGDLYPVAGMIGRRYAETARRRDYIAANVELRAVAADVQGLKRHDLNLSWADEALCDWATSKAKTGVQLVSRAERTDCPGTLLELMTEAQKLARLYGFKLPDWESVGILPAMRRAADAAWWRRQARRAAAQEVERVAVLMRRVNKAREIYCSDLTVARRQGQRVRNRRFLEGTTATNEEGQEYTLAELSDVSVSNPRLMRMEWMTRLAGFDEVACLMGHARELWTITAPAEFHPWTTAGGGLRENEKWDKAGRPTARMVMDYMCKMWSRFRAYIGRRDMKVYGMRVVEANHDGTPHWHAAIYYPREWQGDDRRAAAPRMRAIMRRYALGDMADYTAKERAAAKAHRCDFKEVLPGKSAAGYLAKYISKALPAADAADMMQADLYGNPIVESAERVNAWSSTHRIRQFQQLGGPSVTVWRELRRAAGSEVGQFDLLDAPEIIQEAAAAADAHNWAAFVLVMGGPTVRREDQLIRPGYWHEHDTETGELAAVGTWNAELEIAAGRTWNAEFQEWEVAAGSVVGISGRVVLPAKVQNKYGEEAKARIYGVTWEGGDLMSRPHTWVVAKTKQAAAVVQGTRDVAKEARDAIRQNQPEWMPWALVPGFVVAGLGELPRLEKKAPPEKLPPPWCFSVLRRPVAALEFCQ